MKFFRSLFTAALLLLPSIALAQVGYSKVQMPWFQQGKISGGVAVTTSTGPTQLPSSGLIASICNTGSNDVYLAFGTDNTVTATVTGSTWLRAGACGPYDLNPFATRFTWMAAISTVGSSTLAVETGIGNAPSQSNVGGGGGGTVTLGAGSAIAGKFGIDQTTPGTTNGVVVNSGNVGGYDVAVAVTPTVQNAAYVQGNAMGGLQTVSFFRTAGGSAKLNNISMWSKSGSLINTTFYIFNSNPSASTCNDKVAFALGAADISKLIAVTPPVLVPHIVGTGTTATSDSWQTPISVVNADSTTNLYVCPVIGGSVTPSTTTDYVYKFAGPQD